MFGTHFYHQRIRRAVAVFGSLFNNINVVRAKGDGTSLNQVKVPLSYAPKRNFIERIAQMNLGEENERQLAIKLPRMSFEIISYEYDGIRQLPKTNRRTLPSATSDGIESRTKLYTSIPYNIQFELNVYAKTQDDALQIVEQVLPYFNPHYTVTAVPLDNVPEVKDDVPITLTSVSFQDDYEGPLEQRRTIIYTLSFDMKISFYGPVVDSPIIRSVEGEIYNQGAGLDDSDVLLETLQTYPTPDGVSQDSDFGFNTDIYGALDSVP